MTLLAQHRVLRQGQRGARPVEEISQRLFQQHE